MSTHDLFDRLVRALNQAGIPYINGLDREYIEKWITDLQVEAQWSDALKVAGIVL